MSRCSVSPENLAERLDKDLQIVPVMRLLVVGHTYVLAFNQSKYVAMKRLDPTLKIRIVIPSEVGHVFMRYRHTRHPGLSPEETVVIPRVIGKTHMSYVLEPVRLFAVLRRFAPDHIHIEEDPHSLVGAEVVSVARVGGPRASLSFFIWDNVAHMPRFPWNFIKKGLTRYSLDRAALVVCGKTEAEHLLKTVKGYAGRTLVLPQLGLDPEDYAAPPPAAVFDRVPAVPGGPWIGFVGRFVPEKGLNILLAALSRLQHLKWRLLLVGDGPMKEELRTHWQALFGRRLLCLETVPHQAVADYLKRLDVFVLPSYSTPLWKEQFGLTLAQAMMAGAVCVGSSSGAIPEVIGTAGLVVQERNVDSLAQALETVLLSESIRESLRAKARTVA